jgi:hypothetical protein
VAKSRNRHRIIQLSGEIQTGGVSQLEPPPSIVQLVKDNKSADAEWKKWINNLYEYIGLLTETVTNAMSQDFFVEVAKGNVDGHSTVHKFGAVTLTGTSLTPVCQGGFYRTPQTGSTVEIVCWSDDANDTAAGSGAREITIEYLDSTGASQTGTIATAGTSESTESVTGVWRIVRAYVSSSGTYATQTAGSQNGTITIAEDAAGAKTGNVWASLPEIGTSGLATGQSLIGCYTIPLGKTAYILSATITIESAKTPELYFFARTSADETSAPYAGTMRLKNLYIGANGISEIDHKTHESYAALTDIGFLAVGANGDDISVEFELLLVDTA